MSARFQAKCKRCSAVIESELVEPCATCGHTAMPAGAMGNLALRIPHAKGCDNPTRREGTGVQCHDIEFRRIA